MPVGKYRNPQYGLRVPENVMDKLKFIASGSGRSANKEIEQLILAHIAEYEKKHGTIELASSDYDYIRKRTKSAEES